MRVLFAVTNTSETRDILTKTSHQARRGEATTGSTFRLKADSSRSADQQLRDAAAADKNLEYVAFKPDKWWCQEDAVLRIQRLHREFAEDQARVRERIEARKREADGDAATLPAKQPSEGSGGGDGSSHTLSLDEVRVARRLATSLRSSATDSALGSGNEDAVEAAQDSPLTGAGDQDVESDGPGDEDVEMTEDMYEADSESEYDPSDSDGPTRARSVRRNIQRLIQPGESVQDIPDEVSTAAVQSPTLHAVQAGHRRVG